jgi:hypothetical protein
MLRLGWAGERMHGFDEFAIANFLSPRRYLGAKIAALFVFVWLFAVYALLLATLLSGGDFEYAVWYSIYYAIYALFFVPMILLVESQMDTTVPAAVAVLFFVVLLFVTEAVVGVEHLVALMGLPTGRYRWTAMARFAGHALLGVPLLLALVYPFCARRLDPVGKWGRSRRSGM